jgi:hypothetical protein
VLDPWSANRSCVARSANTLSVVRRGRAVLLALAVSAVLVLVCVSSAGADDGDAGPPLTAAETNPDFTGHNTAFDDIAPARQENSPPLGGYLGGGSTTCTSPGTGVIDPQWRLVNGDFPVTLEGQVTSSKLAWDDNGIDHHSRDRNFFVVPDEAFAHLLASPGNFQQGEDNEQGRIEVEWESAAFPAWALPMMGDRVHVEGSWIWDCAHGENGYRTEIHPPRLVMTLRNAADQDWSKDCQPDPNNPDCVNGQVTIPARSGWTDTMPGLGSVPVPVTRADVFASSDGGEAREQETCFGIAFLPPPPGCPPDWYQDLRDKQYDLFVPAPPKPDQNAQLIQKLVPRGFLTCSSDNDCGGAVDELATHPERFTFTEDDGPNPGVHIHVDLTGPEPPSQLYGFGFTLELGWNRPAATVDIPRRFKVTVLGVRVRNPLDSIDPFSGDYNDGQIEISSLIGDTFRHMRLVGGPKVPSYDFHQDVPDTEDVNVGDYGIKTTGSCGLVAPGGADTAPCANSFEVVVRPGQPLRVFFRAEEHDIAENDEAGSVEHIFTAPGYGIGQHTEWFQERTSAGDDALDTECGSQSSTLPCLRITYKIEEDPIPAPPGTSLTVGSPTVSLAGETWVTSASPLGLIATAPSGHEGDTLELHARFWRSGTNPPAESVCGSGASCTLHLNANDAQDGQYTLEYWAVDTTTNAIEAVHSAAFELDNTAPTSHADLAGTLVRGWYDTPVTVTLSAGDNPGVGVDHTSYVVDPPGSLTTYSGPFDVGSDSGSHTVQFLSADKLANTESAKSVSFKIDRTPPKLTVSSASDGAFSYTQDELVGGLFTNASSLAVTYAATDVLSGIYAVSVDGSPIAATGSVNVALPAGISTHKLVAEDVAGNLTTITFMVVSVPAGTFTGGVDPQGSGFWKNTPPANLDTLLAEVNIASRAFGAPDNRYAEVTTSNYQSYLAVNPNAVTDLKVRRELLVAWLNLVSGREPAAQTIDLKSVSGWQTVVTNTGGSSVSTALNLVRESERRLEQNPSDALLGTTQTLLEKLNSDKLNK